MRGRKFRGEKFIFWGRKQHKERNNPDRILTLLGKDDKK